MSKYLVLLITGFLYFSCAINGNFKGLYSYYESTKNQIPNNFITYKSKVSYKTEEYSSPKTCIINGKELLEVLDKYENTIVYIWKPNCKSQICVPIEIVENICITNDYNLFVVSEYYDSNAMNVLYRTRNILFAINTEYYNSNLTKIYLNNFFSDLNVNVKSNDQFYLFKKNIFKSAYLSIDEIEF